MPSRTVLSQRLRVLLAVVCVVAGALVLAAGPAQAKLIHPYTGVSLGPKGLGPGGFSNVPDIAVDQSTGEVYILSLSTETVNGKVINKFSIYRFTSAGEPVSFSATGTNAITTVAKVEGSNQTIAVDSSSGPAKGDIYFQNETNVEIFSSAGAKIGELTGEHPRAITVDSSGAVYVNYNGEAIKRYLPTANPVTDADYTSSLSNPLADFEAMAAGSGGDLYVSTGTGLRLYTAMEFGALDPKGTRISDAGPRLAFNATNEHVYVAPERSRVNELDETGELVSVTGEEQLVDEFGNGTSFALAVDSSSGNLYIGGVDYHPVVGGDAYRVGVFGGAAVVVPDASTEAPTNVTDTTATLNGSVNPGGVAATYQFQYGTTTSYGSVAPASPQAAGSDSTAHNVSAELTGLMSGATYHYRIVASNANGTTYGADQTLYVHAPPTVLTERVAFTYQHELELQVIVASHGLDTHYVVEYGPTAQYGSSTPSRDLGEGGTFTKFPLLEELELGATYHFRVVATNADGTVYGADQVASTGPVATITNETVLSLAASSATLSAKANDYYLTSMVHFEYGTTNAYGASTNPEELEAEEYPLTTTAALSALQAGTTYHYRLVLESQAGVEYGLDATFRTPAVTAPSSVLPDGRAYERVSPAANADNDVYQDLPYVLEPYEGSSTELPFLISPDGNTVAYVGGPSEHGGTGFTGSGVGNQYRATRNASGRWSAANIDPPSSGFKDMPAFSGFSPDLSVGFVSSAADPPLALEAPGGGYKDLYQEVFSTSTYTSLIHSRPEHRIPKEFGSPGLPGNNFPTPIGRQVVYAGSSSNLSHDLFMANDTLTVNAIDGGVDENNLYDTSDGATTLVNVLPDGSPEPNATFGGPALEEDKPYNKIIDYYPMFAHDISEDGSRIFWTDLNTRALYVRENDTAPESPRVSGKCTVPVDACTVLIAENAQYWNATPDGSKVLYTSGGDLYRYDLTTGEATDLAPSARVRGVLAASSDLSYVYFVAEAAFAPGTESHECSTAGVSSRSLCNLYVVHNGEQVKFIGALYGSDNLATPQTDGIHYSGDWQGSLAGTEAEVTPDGTHLLFTSKANLTNYESGNYGEVFLYDYGSGEIHCLSCMRSGLRPEANQLASSAFLPNSNVATAAPRWMSDNGNRAFFDTLDALVPQDINHLTDVYEWERDGSGSCTETAGCIYLLSDGTSPEGSYLIGASANGDDVFMTTRGKLVPEDENENVDVYDMHANAVPPPAAPQCTGSGCQGVPSTPPIFATPPSVTYDGVGNFEAPPKTVSVKPKALTRADKLARALKSCERKPKKKRKTCEAQAKKKYGKSGKSSSLRRLGNLRQSSKGGK